MKLAIFDIDGTLTDTVGLCDDLYAAAVARVAGVASVRLEGHLFPDITDSGLAAAHFARHAGRPAGEAEIKAIRDGFLRALRAAPVRAAFLPGAHDVLARVQGFDGWRVAIATGNWRAAAEVKFGWAGVSCPSVPMGTADDAPARADILRAAVRRAERARGGGPFERVVYLGDGAHDARAARALGAAFIGVTAVRDAAPMRAEGARTFLDHFGDDAILREALESAAIPVLSTPGR